MDDNIARLRESEKALRPGPPGGRGVVGNEAVKFQAWTQSFEEHRTGWLQATGAGPSLLSASIVRILAMP